MAKAQDQMPDFGKSINVFVNDPRVKNPFLRNRNGNSDTASARKPSEPANEPVPANDPSAGE
jgi:hypothetical protein